MKYIDAERLKEILKSKIKDRKRWMKDPEKSDRQDQLWSDLNGEDMSILKIIYILQEEQPEVDLEKAARHVYESWMGGTMDEVRRDMDELGKVLNARKEE